MNKSVNFEIEYNITLPCIFPKALQYEKEVLQKLVAKKEAAALLMQENVRKIRYELQDNTR